MAIVGATAGFLLWKKANSTALEDREVVIYIYKQTDYASVLHQLDSVGVKDVTFFNTLAGYMKYPQAVRTGRYELNANMSYLELIRKLRGGFQDPVKVTFNNVRTKEDLANKVSDQFMFTKESLSAKLNDTTLCASYGFTPNTIIAMFIPNTYEMYWNSSVDQFLDRMKKEYDRFWNTARREKAQKQGLTPLEVSILASIVQEESSYLPEYPIIAGLYLNRLKRGMLLQADPTVKHAVGDVTLQRILFKHLEVDSPYNTYKYAGLPPGPLNCPTIQSIEAVLNPSAHSYLYMCAKEDFSGQHNFATTLAEHNRNARKYQQALTQRGIR